MKTFWKLILILWALTYSPEQPEGKYHNNFCDSCIGANQKTTQTCDAFPAAKDGSVT